VSPVAPGRHALSPVRREIPGPVSGGFIEGFPGGIVPGPPQHNVCAMPSHQHQVAVPAGNDEAHQGNTGLPPSQLA